MLLSSDEQELLDIIKEQFELDADRGSVDLSTSRFKDYTTAQREALFDKLTRSGYLMAYSTPDSINYQVEIHPDFLIEPI